MFIVLIDNDPLIRVGPFEFYEEAKEFIAENTAAGVTKSMCVVELTPPGLWWEHR